MDEITFDASVYRVSTMADYGLRVTLDLPETAIVAAAQLMACKREQLYLHVTITTEKQIVSVGKEDAIQKRRIRKSERSPA